MIDQTTERVNSAMEEVSSTAVQARVDLASAVDNVNQVAGQATATLQTMRELTEKATLIVDQVLSKVPHMATFKSIIFDAVLDILSSALTRSWTPLAIGLVRIIDKLWSDGTDWFTLPANAGFLSASHQPSGLSSHRARTLRFKHLPLGTGGNSRWGSSGPRRHDVRCGAEDRECRAVA